MISPLVVCFSGPSGSGKTTLSKALADELRWPRASFGDYVRAAALAEGRGTSRAILQQLGVETIERLGWVRFCAAAIEGICRPGLGLIVDGVRHCGALDGLAVATHGSPIGLVYVSISPQVRSRRLGYRDGATGPSVEVSDRHAVEAQVFGDLVSRADLVVDGGKPLPVLVRELKEWVARRLPSG